MTRTEHIDLATRIWRTRHMHAEGTCSCVTKPDAFVFLADLSPEAFAHYYMASRKLPVTVGDVLLAISREP